DLFAVGAYAVINQYGLFRVTINLDPCREIVWRLRLTTCQKQRCKQNYDQGGDVVTFAHDCSYSANSHRSTTQVPEASRYTMPGLFHSGKWTPSNPAKPRLTMPCAPAGTPLTGWSRTTLSPSLNAVCCKLLILKASLRDSMPTSLHCDSAFAARFPIASNPPRFRSVTRFAVLQEAVQAWGRRPCTRTQ